MPTNNADFSILFIVQNSDGTPYDLSNSNLIMQFKPYPGPPVPAVTVTASQASGGLSVISPATSGNFLLELPYTTMMLFSPRQYAFDIINNVSSTSRIFLGGGLLNVTEGITENPT